MKREQIHIVISGPQGTGKTKLAEHIAHYLRHDQGLLGDITVDDEKIGPAPDRPTFGNAFRRCNVTIETTNVPGGVE